MVLSYHMQKAASRSRSGSLAPYYRLLLRLLFWLSLRLLFWLPFLLLLFSELFWALFLSIF